ncbi:Gag-Pro-Pol polyprotein [Labeo rohita]|uniref:ribonuclease H n=1 Tax=Labeo rohita TaxID=84645 RepID=A0ABQ8L5R1_LABRO|nr:Gag-Pro-Pol polyprotein [Labeo rohita]
MRPILDLRRLNHSVMWLKFKMLTVKQVVSQIRSEDWFVMIDLKDAYFHVSILPQHKKFLMFAFRSEAYKYQFLPFGLALSPHMFKKCVDAALAPLQLQGIHILNYFNDWLISAQSESLAARQCRVWFSDGRFLSGGISFHRWGASSFTPARSCGCGP